MQKLMFYTNCFHHLHPLSELFPPPDEENEGHNDPPEQRVWKQGLFRKEVEQFSPKNSTLIIYGREVKTSPIQVSNPEKVGPYRKILDQANLQDINCLYLMISVIMASVTDFTPVVIQSRNL